MTTEKLDLRRALAILRAEVAEARRGPFKAPGLPPGRVRALRAAMADVERLLPAD